MRCSKEQLWWARNSWLSCSGVCSLVSLGTVDSITILIGAGKLWFSFTKITNKKRSKRLSRSVGTCSNKKNPFRAKTYIAVGSQSVVCAAVGCWDPEHALSSTPAASAGTCLKVQEQAKETGLTGRSVQAHTNWGRHLTNKPLPSLPLREWIA